jgi:putative oxidoreductase
MTTPELAQWLPAWTTAAVWVAARVCLVAMFPFSALDKIIHWRNSLAQTDSAHVPFGPVLLVAATIVEGVTPFLIVLGVWDRAAAVVLAGFCVVTAFLYHPFWAYPDFWSPGDDSKARDHFWQFLKNFGLTGGLLLVVFAGPLTPPAQVAAHPFRSAGPTGRGVLGPQTSVAASARPGAITTR